MANNHGRNSGSITAASALVAASRDGTRKTIGELADSNPDLLALVTKLVPSQLTPRSDRKGNREITAPRLDNLAAVSQSISRKKRDAKAIMEIFPDMRLAAEIWIVSVISPNDMFTEELVYSSPNNLYCRPLVSGLTTIVREYFDKNYDLLDKFYDILRETGFGSGSYPILVLPESSLDELIHGGPAEVEKTLKNATERERVFKGTLNSDSTVRILGYVGSPTPTTPVKNDRFSFAVENFVTSQGTLGRDMNIKSNGTSMMAAVHDNTDIIKLGLIRSMAQERTKQKISQKLYKNEKFSLESEAINDAKLSALLYSTGGARTERMVRVKSTSETARDTIGECLIMDLPPESVIPITALSDAKKVLAYYVIIDSIGYAVKHDDRVDNFDQMRMSAGKFENNDLKSFLLNKARSAFGDDCKDPTMAQAAQLYGEIVDAALLSSARSGILGAEVTIANAEHVFRVMLARALQGRMTQVLYVPAEMLTYFNYEVNEDGTGRSMLEGIRATAAARAQLRYARLMGSTKNSIGRSRATVTIDDEDADRAATAEMIFAEILGARANVTTANSLIPRDIVSGLGAQGVEIELAGNGPIPGTKVEFTEVQSNYQRPDEALEEELADAMISGVEVPPEMVNDAKRVEYATVAANSNILFAKRVRKNQKRYEPQLVHHVRAILRSDGGLLNKLREHIRTNIKLITDDANTPTDLKNIEDTELLVKLLVSEFISNFSVGLNKPDVKSRQSQSESMGQYITDLDAALDSMIGDDAMDAGIVGEEISNQMGILKKMARSTMIRREMARTGYMPEVLDMFTRDADGNRTDDVTSESREFFVNVMTALRDMLKSVEKIQKASAVEIQQTSMPGSVDNSDLPGGNVGDGGNDSSSIEDPISPDESSGSGGDDLEIPAM